MRRDGFSLLECLVVLSVATTLVVTALPGFLRLGNEWKLWGSTRKVESSLQWGRMHAISSNTSLLFEVSEEGHRYCWIDAASGDTYENSVRRFPDNIRIASAPRRPLRFYHYGNAVPAGTYVVEGKAGSYSVVVSPGGRIRIQRN